MKKRRTLSREFKLEAVKKVVVQGVSFREVARDLGIRDNPIHNWKRTVPERWHAGRTRRRWWIERSSRAT